MRIVFYQKASLPKVNATRPNQMLAAIFFFSDITLAMIEFKRVVIQNKENTIEAYTFHSNKCSEQCNTGKVLVNV